MAGASDKARYYLEQYVPEFQEYERKGIFNKDEITSIASKRSGFEHVLNARGSKPSDYARYATYEMNLDSLRKKRCKRLGVKSTSFSGQRTLFFIFDRGTKKFPGDMGLWMQYINYCQRQKVNKRLAKVFTDVLRLKPREWSLWVLAGKHYAEDQGDMSTARSYLLRGLRFCKDERKLWLEYIRLEMIYLSKLAARRKILGVGSEANMLTEGQNGDGNMLMLPAAKDDDIEPATHDRDGTIDTGTLQKLATAPAFTGALPNAIFDAAMKQFKNDAELVLEIFDLCASFEDVPATKTILQHINDHLQGLSQESIASIICQAKFELFAVPMLSAEFPVALGRSLAHIREGQKQMPHTGSAKLAEQATLIILPYLKQKDDLDEDVVAVLETSARRYLRQVSKGTVNGRGKSSSDGLQARLKNDGKIAEAELLQQYASEIQTY